MAFGPHLLLATLEGATLDDDPRQLRQFLGSGALRETYWLREGKERDDWLSEAALDLQRQGAAQVLVSLGAEGALVLSAEGACQLAVPRVPVCTTVGAGDAVVAGTTAGLMEGMPFADAGRPWYVAPPADV